MTPPHVINWAALLPQEQVRARHPPLVEDDLEERQHELRGDKWRWRTEREAAGWGRAVKRRRRLVGGELVPPAEKMR